MSNKQKTAFTVGELIDMGKWIEIAVACGCKKEVAEFVCKMGWQDRNETIELTPAQMEKFGMTKGDKQ